MDIREPEFRCGGNWPELAALFNYPIDPNDQDWTYTIVEPDRIDEYIAAYNTTVQNPDTKFSLMEMIIQSVEDQPTATLRYKKWQVVRSLLIEDFTLHEYTIYYWGSWESDNITDAWWISPAMRILWREQKEDGPE